MSIYGCKTNQIYLLKYLLITYIQDVANKKGQNLSILPFEYFLEEFNLLQQSLRLPKYDHSAHR